MRSDLITTYIQATLFSGIGLRAVWRWGQTRERRQAHMAWATGLFGLNSLVSAVSSTVWDTRANEVTPRWLSLASSMLLYLAVYAFLVFLSDFVRYPKWLHGVIAVVTAGFAVLTVIERPDFRFVPDKGIVPIEGITNPIAYRSFIGIILVALAVAFGVLWLAFALYGMRVHGLARFRMLSLASGFFLLFAVLGLLPRVLFGNPSSATIQTFINVLRYFALASAPLLFIGFTPPRWIVSRFGERAPTGPERQRRSA